MQALTREVLADRLADRAEITKVAARDEVKWFFDALGDAITGGDDVSIHGFGTFKTSARAARTARNPRTGETVQVAARRVVKFSPATTLTAALKSSRSAAKKTSRGKR